MNKTHIPQTDSIETLARFWDEHDLTDFEDELEDVTERVFERSDAATVRIRLQRRELEMVKRLAQARGVGQAALIRSWVLERLRAG
ncbi:MAG: CopG family antitoxin [Chloroflexi bacterium]|nr:CopG family antitoxin [Chloroflexota bacterium]